MQDQTGKKPCGIVQWSINEFLGKKRPLPSQSSKDLEPATDQQETKKQKAKVSQNACPDKQETENKKVQTTEKLGPSKFNRCSIQKEEMKEKRADVSRKTGETTSKTTPVSRQVEDDEMKESIIIFNNIRMNDIHNYYICSERNCTEICKEVRANMSKDNKFQYKWLFDPKIAFCNKITNGVSPT